MEGVANRTGLCSSVPTLPQPTWGHGCLHPSGLTACSGRHQPALPARLLQVTCCDTVVPRGLAHELPAQGRVVTQRR